MNNNLKKKIHFEDPLEREHMSFIHTSLLIILAYTSQFCDQNNIKCVVTDMISSKEADQLKGIQRKSVTHYEGRAFDLSLKYAHGWTKELVEVYENEINDRFSDIGALAYELDGSLTERPIVIHDSGYGLHGHLQVRP